MNKPAPKEPSMDEILSSIRQIIADDDAAAAPAKPSTPAQAAAAMPAKPPVTPPPARPPSTAAAAPKAPPEPQPLALTPEQILRDEASESAEAAVDDILSKFGAADFGKDDSFGIAAAMAKAGAISKPDEMGDKASIAAGADEDTLPLVEPDDVAFELEDDPPAPEPEPEPELAPEPPRPTAAFRERPAAPPPAPAATPSFTPPPRPAPSMARAAPMPDPTLSSDMAEELLEPATNAAVKHAFTRLNALSTVSPGVTLDDMMREMLRPMLKEWLDEHLPSVVERMVEKEIARISRGE